MKVAILSYEGVIKSCVNGPAEILDGIGTMYQLMKGTPLKTKFDVDIIHSERSGLYKQSCQQKELKPLTGKEKYDLVIVTAMLPPYMETVLTKEVQLQEWILQQYMFGATMASICVGSFLLAATGILNHKQATTHWFFQDIFRSKFPLVDVQDGKIITEQGNIYTCGGAFSFTTFMMYLIEKYCGHEVAVLASKMFMINIHQDNQHTFTVFNYQHQHGDEIIKNSQQYIENNYSKNITIEHIAQKSNISMRQYIRRFETATGNTPLEYLQRVRVEAAKKILETKNININELAYECAYEDVSYFRKIFKRHTGLSPTEYKEKFGQNFLIPVVG